MIDYYFHLGISTTKALRYDFEFPIPKSKFNRGLWHYNDVSEILDPEWMKTLSNLGIRFKSAMIFYKPAGFSMGQAHIDVVKTDPPEKVICAFNWVLGGNNSQMVWYNEPTEGLQVSWLPGNIPVANYEISTLQEACRTELSNGLTLVRTDRPHSIICGPEPRWCFSLRPAHKSFDSWKSVIEAVVGEL